MPGKHDVDRLRSLNMNGKWRHHATSQALREYLITRKQLLEVQETC